mgnify:CR=1 FL=1
MWWVEGKEASIGFDGTRATIGGRGKQIFRPSTGGFPENILKAEALWDIAPLSNGRPRIDFTGDWWEAIQKKPESTHYHISYYRREDEENPAVGFSVVVPDTLFDKYFSIFKDNIIGGSKVNYRLGFDFIGFPIKGIDHEHPTVEEWQVKNSMDAEPICGSEDISIGFHAPENLEVE